MANRYYTILIVPEKTSQVRRIMVPRWALRFSLVGLFLLCALGTVMFLNYWYVMNQIVENKNLKIENRRLAQQVQVFKNKMTTIESTMERVKTFATKLKVITNIEDRGGLLNTLNQKLPDAATNIPATAQTETVQEPSLQLTQASSFSLETDRDDPENIQLQKEYEEMDHYFSKVNHDSLLVEQILQDQYELLADQKAFLAALPTRKPVAGYFTSGFGIRRHPYGGRDKMHEGIDIANHPGTPIKAPADAVVIFANTKPGYGQTVILDHGYGLETWYGHTRRILVTKGQKVRRGDQVALLGSTGRSTGPHLHYEVRVNGTPVDPLSYILEN